MSLSMKPAMKLCIIYNFAQKYREGIFALIEQLYDCHWVFGSNNTDIKGMDLSKLSDVTQVQTRTILKKFTYLPGTLSLIRRFNCFLMLGELYSLSTWLTLILCKFIFHKKKVYLWTHGWYGKEGRVRRVLKRLFFNMSDGVLLYGEYARRIAIQQGYKRNNLYVIHNSLDYDTQLKLRQSMQPSDVYTKLFGNEYPTLIFIGRLTIVKHLDLLIKAVYELKKNGNFYNIIFVGDGEEREHLESLVSSLELTTTTHFYGNSYDEIQNAPLIFNADLCVSPGNVGLTAMHSMVYGTPVLTHDDFPYQMPEFEAIKAGKTGDFFRHNDVNSLAESIRRWFESPEYDRDKIRQACYDEIDNFWTPQFQINIIRQIILPTQ